MEVGKRLSEARQRRNLTLRDIARTTKIPLHYLEAIDRDDADGMPHALFARAFVRAYANEVGVNARELLPDVEQHGPAEPEPAAPAMPAPVDVPLRTRSLFFIVPLVAVFALYYLAAGSTQTPSQPPQADAELAVPAAGRLESLASSAHATASDVELQIQSRGGCIVAATADGRAIPSQAFSPGEPVVLKARGEVILRIGEAGTCAPAAKPVNPAKVTRRAQSSILPTSPVAITHAVDQAASPASPGVEQAPAGSDVVQPQSPDPTEPPPAIGQF